jgi:hypothetical protein
MGSCGAAADELETSTPMRETFAGCCASAIAPTVSSITVTRIDDTAIFFIAHLV